MKRIILFIIPFALHAFTSLRAETSPGDAPDPCALLTKAEIETTFGELRGEPKPDTGVQKEKECHYTNTNGNYLTFRIYTAERWDLQKVLAGDKQAAVSGVGEEAFSLTKGTSNEIYTKKGAWMLEIDGSVDSEKLKALAALAAGKMK